MKTDVKPNWSINKKNKKKNKPRVKNNPPFYKHLSPLILKVM